MTNPSGEESMQQAFAHFMLSGGSTSSKKSKKKRGKGSPDMSHSTVGRHVASSPVMQMDVASPEERWLRKVERKHWQIYGAFQGTLQRDWLAVDDNLGEVVQSISSLRDRIVVESRYIARQRLETRKSWQGYACQKISSSTTRMLTSDDVQLALSNDLLQHEKMMAAARMLLSSLSQAQDALGRRLDELMRHTMDATLVEQRFERVHHIAGSFENMLLRTDAAQEVFSCLAMELYRKQELMQVVLDVFHDDVLTCESDNPSGEFGGETTGRSMRVAERCTREWQRGSKRSHIREGQVESLLTQGIRAKS